MSQKQSDSEGVGCILWLILLSFSFGIGIAYGAASGLITFGVLLMIILML